MSSRRCSQLCFALISLACFGSSFTACAAEDVDLSGGKAMQYGAAFSHSVTFVTPPDKDAVTWDGAVTRALVVKVSDDQTVCYDMNRWALASCWQGGFLDRSNTHHTSYKGTGPPRPQGTLQFLDLNSPGWLVDGKTSDSILSDYDGHYLHDGKVILSGKVGGRTVAEYHVVQDNTLCRILEIGPGSAALSALIAGDAQAKIREHRKNQLLLETAQGTLQIRVNSSANAQLTSHGQQVRLVLPPRKQSTVVCVAISSPQDAAVPHPENVLPPSKLQSAGKQQWPQTFTTPVTTSGRFGGYVADEFGLPEYPFGAWMRFSAVDVFPNGQIAVATLSGDVWLVTEEGETATWKRFATGLYEPLGLKIVDGKILVRGRDRITRLHDLNNDQEADHYESFHCMGDIGPGYHAFIFDLVQDNNQNLYYVISGRKAPSIGEVVRVKPDGTYKTIATHFRHPNGMGFGGPHNWLTIADNPDGKYPSGGMIIEDGGKHGHNGPRTRPFLYILPPKVDSSAGSQIWTDSKRWGPLGGTLVHTSYSKSNISYVLTQTVNDGPPNGFGVQLPFTFKAGLMRGATAAKDGQLYVIGQRGWDGNAAQDGTIVRIRFDGQQPTYTIREAAVVPRGIELTFTQPLDEATVDFDNFYAERLGKSQDEVDIEDVLLVNERTVLVEFLHDDLTAGGIVDRAQTKRNGGETHYRVIPPLAIEFNIKAKDGTAIKQSIYCTVNTVPSK